MTEASAAALAAQIGADKGVAAEQFLVDAILAAIRRGDMNAAQQAHEALAVLSQARS